jgi:hypothetical protein
MIALQPIVDRLVPLRLAQVDGAIEFAALTAAPKRLPAWFVVPTREAASQNQRTSIVHQRVDVRFQIVVVLSAQARNQDKVREDLKLHCDAVTDAILGWQHPEANDVCFYDGGSLLLSDGQVIAWAVQFQTSRTERKI